MSACLFVQMKSSGSRFCSNIRKIKVVIKICQCFDKLLLKVISYIGIFIAHKCNYMDEGLFLNPLQLLVFVCTMLL